jgi:hypothetical protein
MLMHLRLTPVTGLEEGEVVRLGQRVVRVEGVPEYGVLVYRGEDFPVAYVSGRACDGPGKLVVPVQEMVIAGH